MRSREDLPLKLREDSVTDGTAGEVVNSPSWEENKWTRRFFETFGTLERARALAVWGCLCRQSPLGSSRHRGPILWAGSFLSYMKGSYPVQELGPAATRCGASDQPHVCLSLSFLSRDREVLPQGIVGIGWDSEPCPEPEVTQVESLLGRAVS